MRFNDLPQEVQQEVKACLRLYDKAYVSFEYGKYYGKYYVSSEIGVYKGYAKDHEFIGTYKADEVFTPEERIINYIEVFGDYPVQYKGKRDYKLLDSLKKGDKVKFDEEGNIILAQMH